MKGCGTKFVIFLDSDKQKAFKSIHKYINTLSVLNYNSALTPDPNFNIDATSDLDSYLKLDFDRLSPKQKQTTLCCFGIKLHPHFQSHTTVPSHITLFLYRQRKSDDAWNYLYC